LSLWNPGNHHREGLPPIDLTVILKELGGGGHPTAAGLTLEGAASLQKMFEIRADD
jgi:nanoRNase/pAp phosphatase (c-di-AMP/oligoRNAs hydrolase)